MTNGSDDMILPRLREMRKEAQDDFKDIRSECAGVEEGQERRETGQENVRNALLADSLMSKFTTGDFEKRLYALEQKIDDLLKAK